MTPLTEQQSLLVNAVRQPVAAFTVVETDTRYRAQSLINELLPLIGDRPHSVLELAPEAGADALMDDARYATLGWPAEIGVLFLVEVEKKAAEPIENQFWRQMNNLREGLSALNCHIIFFLLPGGYRKFLLLADHLADWTPLKLHIMDDRDRHDRKDADSRSMNLVFDGNADSHTARQRLATLEKQLIRSLQKGMETSALIRRYYLPMFQDAVSINDIHRAGSLRDKIKEADIPTPDLPQWCMLNFQLEHQSHRLSEAESWAWKLKDLGKKKGNDSWKAISYHQLGMITQERGDFDSAEVWYQKSLAITEKQDNEHGAASTYHQLGRIAEERRHFDSAEAWYRKSLSIKEKQGNEHGAAITYHQLGMIAQERRDFNSAETWYRKSLAIEEKQGNEHGAAITYHQLGMIAQEQRDFDNAEAWYRKSLAIEEKQGNEHMAASTYGQVGIISGLGGHYEESGNWLIKSITSYIRCHDEDRAAISTRNFLRTYKKASSDIQRRLKIKWSESGLGAFPED